MGNQVVFNEEPNPIPALKPRGAEHTLVKLGIGANSGQARAALLLLALLAIAAAVYFFAKATPETPKLGPDVPQKGEQIPSNRTL
jgi:hypothetical protein